LLGNTGFNKEYLFKWVAQNLEFYLFLCAIALVFMILGKRFISICMTIGITGGIIVGNFLGAAIKRVNESKIFE